MVDDEIKIRLILLKIRKMIQYNHREIYYVLIMEVCISSVRFTNKLYVHLSNFIGKHIQILFPTPTKTIHQNKNLADC